MRNVTLPCTSSRVPPSAPTINVPEKVKKPSSTSPAIASSLALSQPAHPRGNSHSLHCGLVAPSTDLSYYSSNLLQPLVQLATSAHHQHTAYTA
ncbi:hypothetical protein WJX77_006280 [Trebouxia sp. C0004]